MPQVGATNQISPLASTVSGAVADASASTGVDFNFLMNQARIESGMNPNAHARTSSAAGLYQFTRQTWMATLKSHGADHDLAWAANAIRRGTDGRFHIDDPAMRQAILDLRYEPAAASSMAAELASDNQDYLTQRLGRPPENVDLYLAHFLGAAGAGRFLEAHQTDPNGDAASLLPAAAAANHSIFYTRDGQPRTLDAIRDRFAARLQGPSAPIQFAGLGAPAPAFLPVAPDRFAANTAEFPPMLAIEPMPHRLSLEFARSAYQRLASLQRGDMA
ncbi:MAG: hypothetical protein RL367_2197 [Pseudomonadota bacterium]